MIDDTELVHVGVSPRRFQTNPTSYSISMYPISNLMYIIYIYILNIVMKSH